MELNLQQNSKGYSNLYFGHPFSKETYTNSCSLKTVYDAWACDDLDGVYSGKHFNLVPINSVTETDLNDELRVIRGTKCMFIGCAAFVNEMIEDKGLYHNLKTKAMVRFNNPDYLDFSVYTSRILNDPLQSPEDMKSISPELAKKYMEYAVKYDKDKKYSDKMILKPYYTSIDSGLFFLSEDFVDFNLQLKVSETHGVVGCEFWISDNTSKYTAHYKEI